MKKSVAILLTCFNRKEKTIKCLKSLYSQNSLKSYRVSVYLVDDNSLDGTVEAVINEFPSVSIIRGTGDLYWTRGMQLAWINAEKINPDYYLWLNDDVEIYDYCFSEILECSIENNHKAVVSGVIESMDKSAILYGGYTKNKKIIVPDNQMCNIHNLNGNVVLVPKYVYQKLGKFDSKFHHDIGDVDYGLRAKKNGIKVLTTKCPVGCCEKNTINRLRRGNTSLTKRFKVLFSPLGANPNILFYFNIKHFSIFRAVLFYVYEIIINIFPDYIYNNIVSKNKSQKSN